MGIDPILATLFFVVGFAIAVFVTNSGRLFSRRGGRSTSRVEMQGGTIRLDQLGKKPAIGGEDQVATGRVEPTTDETASPTIKPGAKPVKARRQKKR